MNDSPETSGKTEAGSNKVPPKVVRFIANGIGPIFIIVAAFFVYSMLMNTRPTAPQRNRERLPRLVDVQSLFPDDRPIQIEAYGTITPSREVILRPRVNGEILSISESFLPGGTFAMGETLLQIDPRDYELNVEQSQAQVAQATSTLRLEQGQQEVARKDYELMGEAMEDEDLEFVLREPQRLSAEANLKAAEARLKAAELDLERTAVRAPFDATVVAREVNVGTVVGANTALARIVGTDAFWIELEVPVDTLRWMDIPRRQGEIGSPVRIYDLMTWGPDVYREGTILRSTGEVDPRSRLATLIVEVPDPLALEPENQGKPPLLLNSYVRTEIFGKTLDDVYAVPRDYVRDNDTLWILDEQDRLDIRELRPLYRGRNHLIVADGLEPGTQIVTTSMATPVQGMALRTTALSDRPISTPSGPNPDIARAPTEPRKTDKPLSAMTREERQAFFGSMSPEERRDYVLSLPPEERKKLQRLRQSGGGQ